MRDDEEGGGVGLAAGVGAVAGAGTASYLYDNHLINKGIKQALEGNKDAPAKIADEVGAVLKDGKNSALATQNKALDSVRTVSSLSNSKMKISGIEFTGKAGEYTMHSRLSSGRVHQLTGVKSLPESFKVGELVQDQKIIKELTKDGLKAKPFVESGETLAKGVRKAGNFELGSGLTRSFNGMSLAGKGKVVGAVVAATAAGAFVVHSLAGGHHSNHVTSVRAEGRDMGRS